MKHFPNSIWLGRPAGKYPNFGIYTTIVDGEPMVRIDFYGDNMFAIEHCMDKRTLRLLHRRIGQVLEKI